ncbi:DUF2071 domain-containing protein [Streptomyces albidochromogenes]|uniref:DUF2071 domain-containing protein n=1 Tax=Streptomyces albidochromogenes TaxID=329524 RepID=A0ABW6FEQ9_9ACTN
MRSSQAEATRPLDHWLTNRFRAYSARMGLLWRTPVRHEPWATGSTRRRWLTRRPSPGPPAYPTPSQRESVASSSSGPGAAVPPAAWRAARSARSSAATS